MKSCILPDQLQNYLGGRVSQATSDMVVSHLKACSNCRALLSRLTPQPVAILQAAHSLPGDSKEFEPELLSVLSIIGEFRSVAEVGSASNTNTLTSNSNVVPGGQILGNYEIKRMLGEGGMGTVYLARHLRLNKAVALKLLKADRDRNPQAIARFKKEMLAVGQLDHQNIVRAHDAGEVAGKYFLAMEFIAGHDLGQFLQIEGRVQVPLACELIRQAALGLQHAHDHGLVHRDVKPSNLMLSPKGEVKVLDLGLAQLQIRSTDSSELTREGQLVGTWLYMAPEQLLGSSEVDSRSDVFSLGVTFYSLLNGGLSLSPGQRAIQLPSINSQRDDVPSDVQSLLEKMLSPRPEDRIQTMTDVASTLEPHSSKEYAVEIARKFEKSNAANRVPTGDANTQEPSKTPKDPVVISPSPPQPPPPPLPPPEPPRPRTINRLKPAVAALSAIAALLILGVFLGIVFRPEPKKSGGVGGGPGSDPPPKKTEPVEAHGLLELKPVEGLGIKLPKGIPADVSALIDGGPAIPLVIGSINRLPLGTYSIVSKDPNVLLEPEVITVVDGQTAPVKVQQLPPIHRLYPRLPITPGAYMVGGGTIWTADMPANVVIPYEVRMTMQGVDPATNYYWMQIEVTTTSREGKYKETGWLLVDSADYQQSNKLQIKSGWVEASSGRIESRLEYLHPLEKVRQLTVKFDAGKDRLRQRAKELRIKLPLGRVSVHDVLVLLFPTDVDSDKAAVAGLRNRLASKSERLTTRELVPGIHGKELNCFVIRSDESGTEYSFFRHESVPFSIVEINVDLKDQFRAGFKLTGSGPGVAKAAPTMAMESKASTVTALKTDKLKFHEAALPEAEGALAQYGVEVVRGDNPKRLAEVRLRTVSAARADESGRWLEVVVDSTTSGYEFKEEALLRVLDKRDQGGEFTIEEGWIRCEGEVFPWNTAGYPPGDRAPLEQSLLMLGKKPSPQGNLTIHEVLSLLFGARLKSSAHVGILRTNAALFLEEFGVNRALSEDDIELNDMTSLAGETWEVPPLPNVPLDYKISRSRKLPFNFNKVTFSVPRTFKLISVLTDFREKGAPSLLSTAREALAAAALVTDLRLKPVVEVPDPENWREWATADMTYRVWAEFRGEVGDGEVLLGCLRKPGVIVDRQIALKELREEDQKWIRLGRTWHFAKGDFARRAVFVKKLGGKVWLRQADGTELQVAFADLSESDQNWITYLLEYRKKMK